MHEMTMNNFQSRLFDDELFKFLIENINEIFVWVDDKKFKSIFFTVIQNCMSQIYIKRIQ